MAEPGLRPAASLPNSRSRRHVLSLMSLPSGSGQDPTRRHHSHGATDGPLQRVLRTGRRDIPAGGRANGTPRQYLDRRRGVGGAGGKQGGLPTRNRLGVAQVARRREVVVGFLFATECRHSLDKLHTTINSLFASRYAIDAYRFFIACQRVQPGGPRASCEAPMSEGRLHRWRRIGTARKKWRRRRWATGRSKRSSYP